MQSIMQHNFADNGKSTHNRSKFGMPWGHKTTMKVDYLIPFYHQILLPGDDIRTKTYVYARLTTPFECIMDNMYLEMYFFKMPVRNLWDNFRKWFGERRDPDDHNDYLIPIMDSEEESVKHPSVWSYVGIPTGVEGLEFHAWWSRFYNSIHNWWFRAQHVHPESVVDYDDGPDDMADYPLLKVCKKHDYFTSMNPYPLLDGEHVPLPILDQAPVYGNGNSLTLIDTASPTPSTSSIAGLYSENTAYTDFSVGLSTAHANRLLGTAYTPTYSLDENEPLGMIMKNQAEHLGHGSNVYADLSEASAVTIDQLRECVVLQHYLELLERTGTRYNELMIAVWGVKTPDNTIQIPEYIGGGKKSINVHQVIQTSEDSANAQMGKVGAFMDVYGDASFHTVAEEPCLVMGVCCVRSDVTYQDGLDRKMSFRTLDEFYRPPFANLSEQPIYMKELYTRGDYTHWDDVIGYNGRWDEWRFNKSIITGQMNSFVGVGSNPQLNSIDSYHLAEQITQAPDLTGDFLYSNTPVGRVLAAPNEDHVIADFYHDEVNIRNLPLRSIPGVEKL